MSTDDRAAIIGGLAAGESVSRPSIVAASGIVKTYRGGTRAVGGVDLEVIRGECLGLVGQSGCGKSTLSRCILGLEQLDAGSVALDGVDLTSLSRRQRTRATRDMQMVFQNPGSSLNARLRVGDSVAEPLLCFPERRRQLLGAADRTLDDYVGELLRRVELDPGIAARFPSELSGGQKQRVAIARALSTRPKLVILDEPTASLDVSVQARVLNLLKDLQDDLGLSYLFISHDLAAVRFMSDRIMVMRQGLIVDRFDAADTLSPQRHEYTRELIDVFRT